MFFASSKQFNYLIFVFIACVVILVNTHPIYATDMLTKDGVLEIVYRQAEAWQSGDAEAIASDFAKDAVFVVPGMRFEGRSQIKAAAQDYFQQFTDTKIQIKNTIIEGNRGAVEWDWRDRPQTGSRF